MKKYIVIFVIMLLVISVSLFSINKNIEYRDKIALYDNNLKALTLKADTLENSIIAYKLDLEQLEYINDSIITELNNARINLDIKDTKIKQMQYILSEGNIKDTLVLKDTLFRDNFIGIDTTLKDKWYSLNFKLEYPSTLSYNIKYRSELEVFMFSKKEYVGTPKKCFIGRWFQKKYKTTSVTVIDKNPYAEVKDKKFVFINQKE